MMLQLSRFWIGFFLAVLAATSAGRAADRAAEWRAVEEAVQKGLPRTAITNLNQIIPAALRDRAYGEAAKGIARRVVLEGTIEGNKAEEKIGRMEGEIGRAPAEIKPLLQALLANWYWHYFQNNRWRFMRRTGTAAAPGKDFTTWDLPRLFAEIDKQFAGALAGAEQLKTIPVATFNDLLLAGTLPDRYRPTLYDFIAQEALKFYTSGEQAGARPQDAFEVSAESPLLGNATEFLAWNPETTDTNATHFKAIRLYQQLLRFHQADTDVTAWLDADLGRLQMGNNIAAGETKDARYQAALQALVERYADHELSALALYRSADVVHRAGDYLAARRLAQRAVSVFPDSVGGRLSHNLIQLLEGKTVGVTTERVWNAPLPDIVVNYRNVTNVWFRAVAWSWAEFLDRRRNRPESLNEQERAALLAKDPALSWSAGLPATTNLKSRTEILKAPTTLAPGFYFLIASCRPDFSRDDNQVLFSDFWVSDLALIVRPREGQLEGFVLEANSGEPVKEATVEAWYLDQNGTRVSVPGVPTDENGVFLFPPRARAQRGYLLRARHGQRELAAQQEYWSWQREPTPVQEQTYYFTDRALYRPGQTIQFKGIAVRVDVERDNYDVLAGRNVTVIFADPNGKEIARQEHRCNDYGSFSGSFTAPRGRLAGEYRIYTSSGQHGQASFSVEEYKRPKFQVKLDAPKTAARLNDLVAVPGLAEAYTGAAIDNAEVKWRVVRDVRWPDWWGWWGYGLRGRPRPAGASQEIANGVLRTGVDGKFQIEFTAKPDPKVSAEDEASFHYSVFADVTDSAGETRSDQRGVNVGFVALRASVTADEWQVEGKPVELRIGTTTLDGEPQLAEGRVRIYRLKAPDAVVRPPVSGMELRGGDAETEDRKDLSDPNSWELGDVAVEQGFTTAADGQAKLTASLGVGVYRAMLETQDRFGRKVTGRLPLRVVQPEATRLGIKVPHLVTSPKWSMEPGEEFMALWGTGYDTGRAFIEIEHRGKFLQRFWTGTDRTQQQVRQAIDEAMRGGFTLHVTQIRENRAYTGARRVDVPWSNKQLELKWEHFTSKLGPAQKETWTAVIQGHGRESTKKAAELAAALYDASLDQFRQHHWLTQFGFFRYDHSSAQYDFANSGRMLRWLHGQWKGDHRDASFTYRRFPEDLVANFVGFEFGGRGRPLMRMRGAPAMAEGLATAAAPAAEADTAFFAGKALADDKSEMAQTRDASSRPEPGGAAKAPDLSQVTARRNLNETAFFFPKLLTDSNGAVRLEFTMPEALTEWRFIGFAHDTAMRSGFLEGKTVTSKELMVQPNPPRFVREGDTLEFTVKVSNQSAARQQGTVRLTFADASTEQSFDRALGNSTTEQAFDIPAKESRTFSWRIKVPDQAPFLAYKAVGATSRLSDGEEGYLPVLSRRIFVTESLPLPIRGKAGGPVTRKFEFARLAKAGRSSSLVHQNLVVQMVSNPSWYAVMALPYLMEYPHECTEQTFNRLYANVLARHIAGSNPKIRRVFDQWRDTPALDSPLEKNQDLKSVLLEETPWLRQAKSESQARRNVGILFDENRLDDETQRTLAKLAEMQLADGLWPWFPGGRGNHYITLYITTGFGRLRHLGANVEVSPAVRALQGLDAWMTERYQEILKGSDPDKYVPSATDALYLYGRSFFLKDQAVAPAHQAATQFYLAQSRKHWLQLANRQSQGHLAIALKRWSGPENLAAANAIMKSLKERSVTNEEMGMFWRETELSWWWYRAPIETQALMIEAFDEVAGDQAAVEECRVWLLKQKQTQDWKTTKATADAVYGLLLRGRDLLASDALVEVTMGGVSVTPPRPGAVRPERAGQPAGTQAEAGTGFYEKQFAANEIKPRLGEITVRKLDPGVAWGSVHWQYLEDISKVTPHEGTPLKLRKALFTRVNTRQGPRLEAVKGPLAVGDELVVRLELRVDRDMEYVHLKDQRGSGTEPVNVLSGYRYQDGLAYYESTRDTASHFFIDYLPKGTYVFEYATRVQHRGQYQTGLAEIQCMYAPEFNSHSESLPLTVR
jgi:tetratricopeptide (TPR) repeat protein